MARIPNLWSLGMAAFLTTSALVGAPLTSAEEGLSLVPYYDGAGIKTWCRGETEVNEKEKYTLTECDLMYNIRYGYYSYQTALLYNDTAKAIVTPKVHAAMTDMSYNVGLGAVGKSTMIRELNAGKAKEACKAILLYKYSGGVDCSLPENKKVCGGIWSRRQKIEKLCQSGI